MSINIQQSIIQQQIIKRKTFWGKVSRYVDLILWLLMPTCLIMVLFNGKPQNQFFYLFYSIMWIPVIWYIFGLKYIDKLTYLGKHDSDSKKTILNNFISDFDVKIIHQENDLIILKKETGFFNWGKEITMISSESQVWVNITTLGRHDIKSPFHSYLNYRKLLSK